MSDTENRFCPNLHPNPPGQAFCGECGNPLITEADAKITNQASTQTAVSDKPAICGAPTYRCAVVSTSA